jgi:tRNA modification GTPase
MERKSDLIVALATPEAVSAIAVVRLSGKGASATVESLMNLQPGRLAGKKRAVGDFAGLDNLVAIAWPEGRSYTGEEMVDLMCHGSPGTAGKILKKLVESGARIAYAGEFTRRAWLNGKLTALDVLALSARFSLDRRPGKNKELAEELSELTSEIEGFIEFSEEHEVSEERRIVKLLQQLKRRTGELKERVERAEMLPRVFIMGPVNAGKSTLFNRLYGSDTVVVSSAPGTTRDGATRYFRIAGRTVEITDSAGYGGDRLDGIALNIAEESLRNGDRIVWMDPKCGEVPEKLQTGHTLIKVCSKCDREEVKTVAGWLPVSSKSGAGYEELSKFIVATEKEGPSWRLGRMYELTEEAMAAAVAGDMALTAEIMKEVLIEAEEPARNADAVERALERFCVGK